jgi:hypothetical protein
MRKNNVHTIARQPVHGMLEKAAPAKLPGAADAHAEHPYAGLDQALRGAVARLTGGVSPFALVETWTDWALHLARAPGRQLELAEHARDNTLKLAEFAAKSVRETNRKPPFAPKLYDHRFADPGWQEMPFSLWQQAFLATQDWWDHATENMRGLRAGFRADTVSGAAIARHGLSVEFSLAQSRDHGRNGIGPAGATWPKAPSTPLMTGCIR